MTFISFFVMKLLVIIIRLKQIRFTFICLIFIPVLNSECAILFSSSIFSRWDLIYNGKKPKCLVRKLNYNNTIRLMRIYIYINPLMRISIIGQLQIHNDIVSVITSVKTNFYPSLFLSVHNYALFNQKDSKLSFVINFVNISYSIVIICTWFYSYIFIITVIYSYVIAVVVRNEGKVRKKISVAFSVF